MLNEWTCGKADALQNNELSNETWLRIRCDRSERSTRASDAYPLSKLWSEPLSVLLLVVPFAILLVYVGCYLFVCMFCDCLWGLIFELFASCSRSEKAWMRFCHPILVSAAAGWQSHCTNIPWRSTVIAILMPTNANVNSRPVITRWHSEFLSSCGGQMLLITQSRLQEKR